MTEQKTNAAHRNTVEQLIGSLPSPGDSWARVELWRWQYGTLPQPSGMRPLDVASGLRGMAAAIRKGDHENFPSPMNVATVLEYAARLIAANAAGQGRREATYPEPAGSALDSDEPDEREERCDSCGEVSCCLMRGLCPMCYEVNGGTHD